MTDRFLCIAADGETILAVLQMSATDAALNTPAGGSVVAIEDDTGARIDDRTMKISGGAIVDAVSLDPVTDLSAVTLTAIE